MNEWKRNCFHATCKRVQLRDVWITSLRGDIRAHHLTCTTSANASLTLNWYLTSWELNVELFLNHCSIKGCGAAEVTDVSQPFKDVARTIVSVCPSWLGWSGCDTYSWLFRNYNTKFFHYIFKFLSNSTLKCLCRSVSSLSVELFHCPVFVSKTVAVTVFPPPPKLFEGE